MDRPYLALEHPIRMAHRGSRALWPENTMVAFGEAIDLGYRYVETDVRVTLDGVVVAFHDAELDRTTNAMGKISDWLWEDLRHLDAGWSYGAAVGYPHRGNGVGIPRLDEVLATWPDVHFNIDLKASGIEWAVADVITRARRRTSTMIGSFHDRRIAKFRRITRGEVATSAGPATVARAWAASRAGRSLPGSVDAYQVPARARSGLRLDRKFVAAAHAAGSQVHAWTVNEAVDMEQLLDIGVDGIITDRPDTLNDVLRRRGHDV
jgi:glycerophosphoryl diester phosphodiesterase